MGAADAVGDGGSVVVVFVHGGVALHGEHKRGSTLSCFCAKWSPKSTSSQPAQETPSSTSRSDAYLWRAQ
jgi:hypothetical protein